MLSFHLIQIYYLSKHNNSRQESTFLGGILKMAMMNNIVQWCVGCMLMMQLAVSVEVELPQLYWI